MLLIIPYLHTAMQDTISLSTGLLQGSFFPTLLPKESRKWGHPTPRQGAAAPWNPAFSDPATALSLSIQLEAKKVRDTSPAQNAARHSVSTSSLQMKRTLAGLFCHRSVLVSRRHIPSHARAAQRVQQLEDCDTNLLLAHRLRRSQNHLPAATPCSWS